MTRPPPAKRDPAFLSEVALGARRWAGKPGSLARGAQGEARRGSARSATTRSRPRAEADSFGPALALLAGWRRVAGAQISHRCPVLGLSAGTLVVGTPDVRWQSEITRHADRLAADLARAGLPVRALRCEPIAERAAGSAPQPPARPPAAPAEPEGATFTERFDALARRMLSRRGES